MRKFIRRTYKKFNQTCTKIIHVAKSNKQPPQKKEIVPPMKIHNKLIKSAAVAEKTDLWDNFIIAILTRTGLHKRLSLWEYCTREIRKPFGQWTRCFHHCKQIRADWAKVRVTEEFRYHFSWDFNFGDSFRLMIFYTTKWVWNFITICNLCKFRFMLVLVSWIKKNGKWITNIRKNY